MIWYILVGVAFVLTVLLCGYVEGIEARRIKRITEWLERHGEEPNTKGAEDAKEKRP